MLRSSPSGRTHRLAFPLVLGALLVLPLAAQDSGLDGAQDSALVTAASGQVSTEKHGQAWAIGEAERVAATKPVVTGPDGYARLQVEGGTSLEVFAQTHLTFRPSVGTLSDLLSMTTGRVRVSTLVSAANSSQYRIETPVAIIATRGAATLTIAVDDVDDSTRIDVQQGEILVQHALLPRGEPVLVKAGDAISVNKDTPLISRRLDRGSLYRYGLHSVINALGTAVARRAEKNLVETPPSELLAESYPEHTSR